MSALGHKRTFRQFQAMSALPPIADIVPAVSKCGLRRGPPVLEVWTNRGQVFRRLGEPNAGRGYGSHRLAAVPQSALRGGSSQSHDSPRFSDCVSKRHPCSASHFRNVAYSLPVFTLATQPTYLKPEGTVWISYSLGLIILLCNCIDSLVLEPAHAIARM